VVVGDGKAPTLVLIRNLLKGKQCASGTEGIEGQIDNV
jgi:hypothetical protein